MADESLPGCAAKVDGAAEPSVALAKGQSLSLHVAMDNFYVRPTGCYSKPLWERPAVLQISDFL